MKKFVFRNKELFIGQKVECIYYHEYDIRFEKRAYKRSWLSKLIDKPFKPVKLGIIVGNAGIHPYWLGNNGIEQYLLVKFKEYRLPKPIPISCIYDALQSAIRARFFLEQNKNMIGEKGYSQDAFNNFATDMNNAFNFINS